MSKDVTRGHGRGKGAAAEGKEPRQSRALLETEAEGKSGGRTAERCKILQEMERNCKEWKEIARN